MFSGVAWSAIERFSIQFVQFIIGIVLARILTPKEYGVIGILMIFIVISQVFIDSGFTKALIHDQNRTRIKISTVFYFNLLIGVLFYGLLWVGAPWVAKFYDIPSLTLLLRVLALTLIINALGIIPLTLFTIDLNFKFISKANLVGVLISGGVAIYLAKIGWGVWALVWQILIRSTLTTGIILVGSGWRPIWAFSVTKLKQLFAYGSNLLVSSLLNTTVNQFSAIFVGKVMGARDLGFYTRGTQFTDVAFSSIHSILERILLPGLAPIQDNRELLIKSVRRIIKTVVLLCNPLFLLLAVLSEPLIRELLTEKWLPAVPIMQIFCIARFISVPATVNVNLLYVLGRTDLALKQQYVKIIVRIVLLLAALPFGIIYVAFAELTATIIHFFINAYYPGKIMKYGAIAQIKDSRKILLTGVGTAILSYFLMINIPSDLIQLLIIPLFGIAIYLAMLHLLKIPEYLYLRDKTVGFLKGKL